MKKILSLFLSAVAILPTVAQTSMKNVVTDKLPGSNCDNAVHNILPADAQNRSPSECEVQFDLKARTALRGAFSKALQNFPESDWVISDTAVEVLTQIGKETENKFFGLSYYFKIDLAQKSPLYMEWYNKYQNAMQQLQSQPGEASTKKFSDSYYQMNNAIHIRFYILVNPVSYSIYFIKGGQQTFTVPGASFAVKGTKAGALSGGGEDNAMDACLILFGNQKPVIKKEPDGGASVYAENNFPKNTSRLTVQNISVRIECNNELLNQIIKDTDFKALADLIGK
jgi:hypothetical protein